MTFSIFSDLKEFQKIAITITSVLVVVVSIYVVLFNLISFDGAFNTQAAINLYHKGTLALNYRSNISLQTLLPFQIVNGFFLTIFGNTFLAANLANVLFYLLLFGLFIFISCRCKSALPMLAFSCISLSPSFLKYGFGGFGEVPALTYGLLGVSVLVFRRDSYMANILSGMLIAFAITTKWVLFLILPPVLLTLFLLKLDKKKLLLLLATAIFTFIIVSFIQFSHLEPDEIEKLSQSLIMQNTPHYGSEYLPKKVYHIKTYGLRLIKIWKAYSSLSFGIFGPIKIGLSIVIFFVAIRILFSHRDKLKSIDNYFIFLAGFLFVYLVWAFALNSRWPIRRMLNSDILLYLGISLLPCITRFGKTGRFAIVGFFSIFISISILFLFTYTKEKGLISVIDYESQMKKGIELLPKGYNAYGNGVLEAPEWSFLSKKNFKDVFRDSIFYDCIENDCQNYLFTDPSMLYLIEQHNLILETFTLKEIFEFCEFRISKIERFNSQEKRYVELIDFTREKVKHSIARIHNRNRDKIYAAPHFELNEMAAFLNNSRGLPQLEIEFAANECHHGKNLKVALLNKKRKLIRNFLVTRGENRIEIFLPNEFRGSKIDVYLLLEKRNRNIGIQCKEQNANRIPLGYKRIQVVDRSIPNIS